MVDRAEEGGSDAGVLPDVPHEVVSRARKSRVSRSVLFMRGTNYMHFMGARSLEIPLPGGVFRFCKDEVICLKSIGANHPFRGAKIDTRAHDVFSFGPYD